MKNHSVAKFSSSDIWKEIFTAESKACRPKFWNQPIALWSVEYRDIDHIFNKSLFLFCALFSSFCKWNYTVKWEEKPALFLLNRVACLFQLDLCYGAWCLNQFCTCQFSSQFTYSCVLIFYRRKKHRSLHCLPNDSQRRLHSIQILLNQVLSIWYQRTLQCH